MDRSKLREIDTCAWELPAEEEMRVPARVYADKRMLDQIFEDNAPEQARNVATLPGIVTASFAMPDIHWGYGFPIGGVAAFDMQQGVVSPGGVGYDINCGVRLMTCGLTRSDVQPKMKRLVTELFGAIPSGVGSAGALRLSSKELGTVATDGARWAVSAGYGNEQDLEHIEENGCMPGADPDEVSKRAWQRGRDQVGTLGGGNHFIEVGFVETLFEPETARTFGLAENQVTLMVHCGSRGFGHQVCDDSLAGMRRAAAKYNIDLPDRQLACAPLTSPEAKRYLGGMRAAVNYAFANRQVIAHFAREVFADVFGNTSTARLRTLYEVAHNIAKIEKHTVDGQERELCVHRKGATRAFGPGRPEVPAEYRDVGQPVLVPGDMGTSSYILVGTDKAITDTFGSACHGAGRAMSRRKAQKAARGRNIFKELAEAGIFLKARSRRTVGEEMPEAYKDVSEVVDTCHKAGIARKVARILPLGVIKG